MPTRSLPPDFNRGVVTTVHQGDCLVSDDESITLSTVLGSCVSACIRDTVAMVGGMNHFLLAEPAHSARERFSSSARYGAFAMERLINGVLSRGSGRRSNLEVKLFGGGMSNSMLSDVGAKNIAFVREFLSADGFHNIREDVGGTYARRVLYKPATGRAFVRRLDSAAGASVAREELAVVRRPLPIASSADIEIF